MNFKKKIELALSSKSKKNKIILILILLGLGLLTISSFYTQKTNNQETNKPSTALITPTETYVKQLEEKINFMVNQIEGVGQAQVTITMENGVENIYANSEKKLTNSNENLSGAPSQRNDVQRDVVVIDGVNGKQALIVTQKEPTVKGVVVVCEGAENGTVAKRVTDAVSKALHIKTNRLSVVKGSPIKQ